MSKSKYIRYFYYIIIFFYVTIVALAIKANDRNYLQAYAEYYTYSDDWYFEDGSKVHFPYEALEPFTFGCKLDKVYYDDRLILWNMRYEDVQVYIDDELVFDAEDNTFLGRDTNAGKNILLVPMREEFSGKNIKIFVKPQKSLYKIELTSAIIVTASDFFIDMIKKSIGIFIEAIILMTSGILFIIVALAYRQLSPINAKYRYNIIFLAGVFSAMVGLWTVFDSRVIGLYARNAVANALLTYLTFDTMSIPLIAMMRSITKKNIKTINILYAIAISLPMVQILLFVTGIMDLTESICLTQILDGVGFVIIGLYVVRGMPSVMSKEEKIITRIGSGSFAGFGGLALLTYLFNRTGPYKSMVLMAVFIYILTEVFLVVARMQLADEEQLELEQNRRYAYTDSLTKLANARAYTRELEELRKKPMSENLSVIFVDINRLKFYNDSMGHDMGDRLIVGAADCIRDAFGNAILTSRRGGDEFVILMDVSPVELDKCIVKFGQAIEMWNTHEGIVLSVSLGGASAWDYKGVDVDRLCEIADSNMYRDKEKYYNRAGFDRRR